MILYKYFPAARIFDVLEKGLIRFTQPRALNDPFEMLPHFHSWGNDNHSKMSQKKGDFWNLVRHLAPKIMNEQIQISWDKLIGILCLTEKPDSLLMWAHYSGNHTGFVVGFDTDHPFFDQRKSQDDIIRYVARVEYSQFRPKLSITEMKSFEIFLVKSLDWEYEQEWRMILPLSEAANNEKKDPGGFSVCLFKLPSECIKQVIMGCRMTTANKAEIKKLIESQQNRIKLSEFLLHESEFSLTARKVIFLPKVPKVILPKVRKKE